jgi:excisionase family DNA binding protein
LCGRCYQTQQRHERRAANPLATKVRHSCRQCQQRIATRKGLCARCYQAKRRREQPDRVRAVARACYWRNRDGLREIMQRYYAAHAEELRARKRARRAEHLREALASERAYRQQTKARQRYLESALQFGGLTVPQAALYLKVDESTVGEMLSRGDIRGEHTTGQLFVIPLHEVERWRERRRGRDTSRRSANRGVSRSSRTTGG